MSLGAWDVYGEQRQGAKTSRQKGVERSRAIALPPSKTTDSTLAAALEMRVGDARTILKSDQQTLVNVDQVQHAAA